MKSILLALLILTVVLAASFCYWERRKTAPVPAPARTAIPVQPGQALAAVAPLAQPDPATNSPASSGPVPVAPAAVTEAKPTDAGATAFSRAIDTLVSPQSTFQQRQAAWKELRDENKLAETIAALKQGMADNPLAAEYSTALGEAYIYQLPTLTDFTEKSILALQADQSFDRALKLDPANWEAQYFKAAALAHWPAEMNKGPEVIQRLSTLIDQQETVAPQPQFARTYVLLGEEYQKAGQPDYALQTWRLGLAKFPGNSALLKKVNGK